jgi:Carboxypeptidase regulatory-like domain
MSPRSLLVRVVALSLLTLSGRIEASTLEGIVKDPAGHPIKGADVRIEAKNFSKIVKTNAAGQYTADGLSIGTYKVTLVVRTVKASIVNATTRSGKPTQLNFDLTAKTAPVKKHTHMVWVPPDTGTLIGGGRWVEVDDNGNPVNNGVNNGVNNIERSSGSALSGVTQSHGAHTLTGGGQ